MTLEGFPAAALSLLMIGACSALIFVAYRRTREAVSPWIIFLGLSILDLYLPVALYFSIGLINQPSWIPLPTWESMSRALLLFTTGLVFFGCGYAVTSNGFQGQIPGMAASSDRVPTLDFSARRAYLVMIMVFAVFASGIVAATADSSSAQAYFATVLGNRFRPEPRIGVSGLAMTIAFSVLPVLLVTTGLFFYHRKRHPWLWGMIVPLAGFLAAATTLSRGYVLNYFLSLALVETMRLKDDKRSYATGTRHHTGKSRSGVIRIILWGVGLFVLYGSARNFLTAQQWGQPASLSRGFQIELQRVVAGEGLWGLTSILDYYPRGREFLGGKTILDMLLLPVPRLVWPDKPAWYGISDITLGMGWPATTQVAVTMPGELYANFGYPGVLLMLVYGAIFGLFHRYRHGTRFRFLYAFTLVPMMLPTFWMSFTGFVNSLVSVPLLTMALWFVYSKSAARVRGPYVRLAEVAS